MGKVSKAPAPPVSVPDMVSLEHGVLVTQELSDVGLMKYDDTCWIEFTSIQSRSSSDSETLESDQSVI